GYPPVVGRLLLRDLLLLVDDLAVQAGERAVVFAILVGALTPLPGQVEVLGGHRALHRLRRFGALGFVLLATGSEQQRERERASARGERGASNQGGARGHAHSFRQAYHSGLVYVAWIAGAGPSPAAAGAFEGAGAFDGPPTDGRRPEASVSAEAYAKPQRHEYRADPGTGPLFGVFRLVRRGGAERPRPAGCDGAGDRRRQRAAV